MTDIGDGVTEIVYPDAEAEIERLRRINADLLAEVERLKPLAGESGVWKAEALRHREEQHRLEAKVAHIEASGPDHDLRACSTFVREFSDRLMETGRERDALAAEVKHVESDLEHCREAGKAYQRQYEVEKAVATIRGHQNDADDRIISDLRAQVRVLVRDANILLDALKESVEVIDSLADQQAMPDDFYVSPLAYFTGLSKSDPYKE